MRKIWILGLVGVLSLFLAGCGGSSGPASVVTDIPSIRSVDGNITSTGVVTRVIDILPPDPPEVLTGLNSSGTEFRGFLDFPLDGFTGGGIIPGNANIVSATMSVFINSFSGATIIDPDLGPIIPITLELVQFPPPLAPTDFIAVAITPVVHSSFIVASDAAPGAQDVQIDVTDLMREAIRLGVPTNFQLRIKIDLINSPGASGLFGIDERTFDPVRILDPRPLLTVEYL